MATCKTTLGCFSVTLVAIMMLCASQAQGRDIASTVAGYNSRAAATVGQYNQNGAATVDNYNSAGEANVAAIDSESTDNTAGIVADSNSNTAALVDEINTAHGVPTEVRAYDIPGGEYVDAINDSTAGTVQEVDGATGTDTVYPTDGSADDYVNAIDASTANTVAEVNSYMG